MSEPVTELIDTSFTNEQPQPETKQSRELSQAAIASFFYGTLQILFTAIGAAVILMLGEVMKSFQAASAPVGGTDSIDLAEIQKVLDELGITDPSATPPTDPTTPDMPVAVPDLSTLPVISGGTGFPESTPSQITAMEFALIFVSHGFGLLALITAFVTFAAVAKGKRGKGLAVTGLVSGFLSFSIAFMVALAM